jgi:hypothetical protein
VKRDVFNSSYVVSGRWHSTGRVVGIYILFITVVIRFIMVPICSKSFSSYFLVSAFRWFIDEIALCVALALYLSEQEILALLLEHMILLVECIGFV